MKNKIILASASPRRRELLDQIGIAYEVMPSRKEERITESLPEEIVQELAKQKALDVAMQIWQESTSVHPEEDRVVVIGADTIVALDGQIMGKPADDADACRMLAKLQGRTHQVYTGVCIAVLGGVPAKETTHMKESHTETDVFYECTEVSMYAMSEEEIAAYVATGEPRDKAGAYAIQGRCAAFIKGISGDYNNVVGLPAARLYQRLKEWRNA